jgi:PQQ-like domain
MSIISDLRLVFFLILTCCVSGLHSKPSVNNGAQWLRQYIGHVDSVSIGAQHLFARTDREISAISLIDGSLVWRRQVTVRQAVHVAGQISTLSDSTLSSWNASSGQKLWERQVHAQSGNCICSDGVDTYVVSGGRLSALDNVGVPMWRTQLMSADHMAAVRSSCEVYNSTVRVGVGSCLKDGSCEFYQATIDSRTGLLLSTAAINHSIPLRLRANTSTALYSHAGALTQTSLVVLTHDFSTVCVFSEGTSSMHCEHVPEDATILNANLKATPTTVLLTLRTNESHIFYNVMPNAGHFLRPLHHHFTAVSSAQLLNGRYVRVASENVLDGTLRIVSLDADTAEILLGASQNDGAAIVTGYPAVHADGVAQPTSIWVSEGIGGHLGSTYDTRISCLLVLVFPCLCSVFLVNMCFRW